MAKAGIDETLSDFHGIEPGAIKRVGAGFILIYIFAYLGVWIATLTPIMVSLPIRVRQIDPNGYVKDLSIVLAIGALLAMLANPFFGRLSDRTTLRMGMRRPWLIIGSFGGTVGILMIALIPSIIAVAVGWCLVQITMNILLAVATAILPDQVPAEQRGKISGYMSMCISVAPTVGAFIVKGFLNSSLWMFLIPILIMGVGSLILAAVLNDRRMAPENVTSYGLSEFLSSFWINWFKYPDFSWIWLSRFFRFYSFAFLLSYQVYYLTDHLGMSTSDASGIIIISTIISALMGIVGANASGWLSDRTKRRKIYVIAGSFAYAIGMLVLAFAHSLPFFYLAIGITGFGQGVFIAMDFAVVFDVLPNAETEAAKNLGVFNIANALPQSIAPAVAPLLLRLGDGGGTNYSALFISGAIASFIAGIVVLFIRKVR